MEQKINRFAAAQFQMLARERLSLEVPRDDEWIERPGLLGDHEMNPDTTPSPQRLAELRSAAVLIPVMAHDGEASVLLTQRTEELPSHAGQVAFPGGKIEDHDADPVRAALREAEEEIGLPPSDVEPIGYLRPYHSTSGYRIVPVVAAVRPGAPLVPDQREVADIFEVPLSFLMDPANHQTQSRVFNGQRRYFYAMPFGERYIWGVTAGIIRELYDEIYRR